MRLGVVGAQIFRWRPVAGAQIFRWRPGLKIRPPPENLTSTRPDRTRETRRDAKHIRGFRLRVKLRRTAVTVVKAVSPAGTRSGPRPQDPVVRRTPSGRSTSRKLDAAIDEPGREVPAGEGPLQHRIALGRGVGAVQR